MISSTFDYHAPTSVSEAAKLLAQHGGKAKILAGGHSLIPLMKLRLAQPEVLIDLRKVSGLSGIKATADGLSIGAMTTYFQIETSKDVKSKVGVLAEATSLVADIQVRNMGTIGGSITHADPAGDLPAVVLALGAKIKTTTSSGKGRTVAIDDWFQGLLTTAIEPDEIVTSIDVPALPKGTGAAYEKFANKASHYAVVGVAAIVMVDGSGTCTGARIGVTGAGDHAVRAFKTEEALKGKKLDEATIRKAAGVADDGIDCLSDIHASAEYRQHLTKVYAMRAIQRAV
ncbi:MAG: xanthine dehydrogenase family protein subunit M, partial [Chloroflexi bacterium]|nr:xanthine dehydrogenase family protein subunit M [Chloroflexota bacterium]